MKEERKQSIYKSTFNTISNVIFMAIFCFMNSKALFIIFLHSERFLLVTFSRAMCALR